MKHDGLIGEAEARDILGISQENLEFLVRTNALIPVEFPPVYEYVFYKHEVENLSNDWSNYI